MTVVLWRLDFDQLVPQLRQLQAPWVVAALLVTVLQILLSAWRWRYTAVRLDLELPLRKAVAEYYLASFINQVLPGGVVGDAGRAWRHGRKPRTRLAALHAVMIERLSGQLALVVLGAALLLGFLPLELTALGLWQDNGWSILGWGLLAGLVLWGLSRLRHLRQWLGFLARDLNRSLLHWPMLPVQLVSSMLVVVTYLGVFWLLALGLGQPLAIANPGLLLALCVLLLAAMAVPLTVAGWGVREGVAALVWPMAGLPAEQGVALSVCYGIVILVSVLPGGLVLLRR